MSIQKNTPNVLKKLGLGFTTIINETMDLIQDPAALGIYCYLSSKPDGWIIREKELMERFKVGRDFIRARMKMLKSLKLISIYAIRDEKGKIIRWESCLLNHIPENPSSGPIQITENPECGSARIWKTNPHINKRESLEIKDYYVCGEKPPTHDTHTQNSFLKTILTTDPKCKEAFQKFTDYDLTIEELFDNCVEYNYPKTITRNKFEMWIKQERLGNYSLKKTKELDSIPCDERIRLQEEASKRKAEIMMQEYIAKKS